MKIEDFLDTVMELIDNHQVCLGDDDYCSLNEELQELVAEHKRERDGSNQT